jgi:hypothetical protein
MFRRTGLFAVILMVGGIPSWSYEANTRHFHKMWYMGHIVSVGNGEFAFRTRWHPNRVVHVSSTTNITCAKQTVPLDALHAEDLVEINALADESEIWGTRVKVHATRAVCEQRIEQAMSAKRAEF